MRILVVEDNAEMADFLGAHLPASGFAVDVVRTGADAISCIGVHQYDLILLDLNLPDMLGEEVCAAVRRSKHVPPILILTVIAGTDTKVRLLNIGADDYLVKPFVYDELLARVRALLRRPSVGLSATLKAGDIELDVARGSVRRAGKNIDLTPKEFALLEYLLRNCGAVASKMSIIEHVWNADADPFSDALDTHIGNLRRKLGEPAVIQTVHGRGYRIEG